MDTCIICYEKFDNYAMINNKGENGKYCINCIGKWINESTSGILTSYPIKTISVYDNNNQHIFTFSSVKNEEQTKLIESEEIEEEEEDYGILKCLFFCCDLSFWCDLCFI